MISLPQVTYVEQFESFMSLVREESSRLHTRIWKSIRSEMDLVHFDNCHGCDSEREAASRALLEFSEGKLTDFAGEEVAASIAERVKAMKLYSEVSEASQMDPFEESALWDVWERSDAQAAEQERIDMFRNEY